MLNNAFFLSLKKLFLKISDNCQENTSARTSFRIKIGLSCMRQLITLGKIVYKKTGEWYIQRQWVVQRVTTSGTTSDNEWQRVTTSGTTSDNEWYNEWQRVVQRTSDNEWERVTMSGKTSDSEWQRMTTSGTTSDNEWQPVTSNDEEWQRVAITPEVMPVVTVGSSNRCMQNLCKFIKEYYCGIS